MANESIQLWQTVGAWFAVIVAGIAAFLAWKIGKKQNEINKRLLSLQDYVAISVVPDPGNGVIKLMNVGKANLYLWAFDMPENNQRLNKPRLISAGTNEAAYYWIPVPKIPNVKERFEFEFKLYLTDEFKNKWISEHGGEGESTKTMQDGKQVDAYMMKVWSYKTYKSDWSL